MLVVWLQGAPCLCDVRFEAFVLVPLGAAVRCCRVCLCSVRSGVPLEGNNVCALCALELCCLVQGEAAGLLPDVYGSLRFACVCLRVA